MQRFCLTTNQKVGGSSPFRRTKVSQKWETFFYCYNPEGSRFDPEGTRTARPADYVPAGSHSPVDCGKERGQRGPFRRTKVSQKWETFFYCYNPEGSRFDPEGTRTARPADYVPAGSHSPVDCGKERG